MACKIDWVIFDIGRVVISIFPEKTVQRFSELLGITSETVVKELSQTPFSNYPSIFDAFSAGSISKAEYLEYIQKLSTRSVSVQELVLADELTLGPDIESSVTLIARLSQQLNVGCFSNTHEIHWNRLLAERSWFKNFKQIFASHEVKLAKPDPMVFEFMASQLNTPPHRCLFIDDMEENVRSAETLGWHTIHCKDPEILPTQTTKILGL